MRTSGLDQPSFSTIKTADGTELRTARWRANADAGGEPRGTVLLLHGRVEFIEKYAETATDWTRRGYDVVTFDWRGQGLSGGHQLSNRQRNHLDDFDILVEDLEMVADTVKARAPDRPLIMMAHSMGSLVAALHLARHPALYAAAILCSPMWGIVTTPWPQWAVRWIARIATYEGFGRRYALGQGDHDPAEDEFSDANPLTGDPARYRVMRDFANADPELRLGGVTYGWLAAAFRGFRQLRRAPLEKVATPVLVLSAPNDRVVLASTHEPTAARFPKGEVALFSEGRHELLMETDPIRNAVWAAIDGFLARVGQ